MLPYASGRSPLVLVDGERFDASILSKEEYLSTMEKWTEKSHCLSSIASFFFL